MDQLSMATPLAKAVCGLIAVRWPTFTWDWRAGTEDGIVRFWWRAISLTKGTAGDGVQLIFRDDHDLAAETPEMAFDKIKENIEPYLRSYGFIGDVIG